MSAAIRILVVDDHALVREMLRALLDAQPDMTVVGTAADGDEAVARARHERPDVVLMDIDMPGRLCFAAAREIRTEGPAARVVFLSAFSNDRYIQDAIDAKASGYVTKDEAPEALLGAVRAAARGLAYFSPAVQSRIVVESKGVRLADPTTTRTRLLTQRELEVVRYIARGLSKKEIAVHMSVTVKTVEVHTQNAMNKLAIHDRVELARFAIREGLAEA